MKANKSTGGERLDQTQIVPEGKHVAILYSIVDLGTQIINSREHGVSEKRQVQLSFELPKIMHEFKQGEGVKPASVRVRCTMSMHEKAQLRSVVQNMIGKQLSESEAKEYEISDLLGYMCQLQIAHDKTETGNYLKILNYINLTEEEKEFYSQKGYEQINPSTLFDLDAYNQKIFDSLPQFQKDIIIKSPEYNKRDSIPAERTEEELANELETEAAKNDPAKIPVNDDLPY